MSFCSIHPCTFSQWIWTQNLCAVTITMLPWTISYWIHSHLYKSCSHTSLTHRSRRCMMLSFLPCSTQQGTVCIRWASKTENTNAGVCKRYGQGAHDTQWPLTLCEFSTPLSVLFSHGLNWSLHILTIREPVRQNQCSLTYDSTL